MNYHEEGLNGEVVRQFWGKKASESSNRWTSLEILEFEKRMLSAITNKSSSVLDLGCGHGELSRSLVNERCELLGVDFIEDYSRSFTEPNHSFIKSAVTKFSAARTFDVVLLFGVVTYLTLSEEIEVYGVIDSALSVRGTAVIKNQCSTEKEFFINAYSDILKSEYSARYPAVDEQCSRLQKMFPVVKAVHYPKELNAWTNSLHIAFFVAKDPFCLTEL
jgi:cyclopropane fatty-acyl-phospholipid synthase-like methyltransferase